MRTLAILTFTSLDGVMQAPVMPEEDPSGGFKSAGWARPFWTEVMAMVAQEAMAEPYDLLLGRRTYDIFSGKASPQESAENEQMRDARKYVATTHPEDADWNNTIPLTDDVPVRIARLKREDGPLLQVHGSWNLIQTLLAHDLIDEFRLWTFPVLLGSGKRLFNAGATARRLSLIRSGTTPNGVVMGIYRPDNGPKH